MHEKCKKRCSRDIKIKLKMVKTQEHDIMNHDMMHARVRLIRVSQFLLFDDEVKFLKENKMFSDHEEKNQKKNGTSL